jgi:hypothetical protein
MVWVDADTGVTPAKIPAGVLVVAAVELSNAVSIL